MALPRKIVIATDLSEVSEAALVLGAALARTLGVEVALVTVFDASPLPPGVTSEVQWASLMEGQAAALHEQLEDLRRARLATVPCELVILQEASAARGIVRFAQERGADLIVVGSHGRTGLKRALLGSVAEKVVRLASCAVLVAR